MNYLKLLFLFIISFPVFSRAWGVISKIETPRFVVRKVISVYKNFYNIDMSEYEGTIDDYSSLSAFFVRRLDSLKRPLENDPQKFLCPCDGKITMIENISADIATQVKGKTYQVTELIRKEIDLSAGYYIVTLYLSPRDYHRFHVPVKAKADSYIHTGWRLYPVNPLSVNSIDGLFIKNERVTVKFDHFGHKFFYVAVGATFVGSIKMSIFDEPFDGRWVKVEKEFEQNQEIGRFEMGSTIVLVIPENMVDEPLVNNGDIVRVGQPLFNLKNLDGAGT